MKAFDERIQSHLNVIVMFLVGQCTDERQWEPVSKQRGSINHGLKLRVRPLQHKYNSLFLRQAIFQEYVNIYLKSKAINLSVVYKASVNLFDPHPCFAIPKIKIEMLIVCSKNWGLFNGQNNYECEPYRSQIKPNQSNWVDKNTGHRPKHFICATFFFLNWILLKANNQISERNLEINSHFIDREDPKTQEGEIPKIIRQAWGTASSTVQISWLSHQSISIFGISK
jgi:hypothetical protein